MSVIWTIIIDVMAGVIAHAILSDVSRLDSFGQRGIAGCLFATYAGCALPDGAPVSY